MTPGGLNMQRASRLTWYQTKPPRMWLPIALIMHRYSLEAEQSDNMEKHMWLLLYVCLDPLLFNQFDFVDVQH